MYKRRDYALLHPNEKEDASSSSESDEEEVARSSFEEEGETTSDEKTEVKAGKKNATRRKQSEVPEADADSDEEEDDSSDDEDGLAERHARSDDAAASNPWAEAVEDADKVAHELGDEELIVQVGKVLKCRLCPRVLCLNEAAMVAHLKSKKHARYLKQLASGDARLLIDSDGEDLTEEAETHTERHARMVEAAAAKVASTGGLEKVTSAEKKRRKTSGRQRQRKRLKLKEHGVAAQDAEKGDREAAAKRVTNGHKKTETKVQSLNRKERRRDKLKESQDAATPALT